jgi:hypothetical protein
MPNRIIQSIPPGRRKKIILPPPVVEPPPVVGPGLSSVFDLGVLELWSSNTPADIPLNAAIDPPQTSNTLLGTAEIPANAFAAADVNGIRWLASPLSGFIEWPKPPSYIRLRDLRDTIRLQQVLGADVTFDNLVVVEGQGFTLLTLGFSL